MKDIIGIIYKLTNTKNNKVYIGKTTKTFNKRYSSYGEGIERVYNYHKKNKNLNKTYNEHLMNSIAKYGFNCFEVIEEFDIAYSEDELNEKEIYWIKHFKSHDSRFGYNKTLGGEGSNGYKHTEEIKQLMSLQRKGRVMNQEWINKIVECKIRNGSFRGENNPMYGKTGKYNPKSKSIIMFNLDGNIVKEFDSITEINKYIGKENAYKFISRVCVSKKGTAYNYAFLFKSDYEEMIKDDTFNKWLEEKYSKKDNLLNKSKSIYQLNKDTLEIIREFNSINEAYQELGISSSIIGRTCRHKSNTAGGYSWIFKEEYHLKTKEEIKELYKNKQGIDLQKYNQKNKVKIICLNTMKTFDSIAEAIKDYNLPKYTKISDVCKGIRKSAGKHPETGEPLKWMYYNDYIKNKSA